MKKLLVSLAAITFFTPYIFGQDDYIRPAELGVSFNLYDFTTAQRIRSTSLSSVLSNKKWAKIGEMSPGIGLTYFKGLKKHVDFAGTLSASFLNYPLPDKPNFASDRLLLAFDAAYQFKLTSDKYWVQPFASAGIGGHTYSSYWGAFIPLGVGLNIDFFNEGKFFISSQYRVPVTTGTANYNFFHAIGFSGRIGNKKEPKIIPPPPPPEAPKDSDGDGIIDANDKCPTVTGVAKYEGCPVPDTDKDGINDDNDKCPAVAGLAKYQGCPVPDTDKDGINDEEDKCPTEAGVARYQGCPVPDTDKDGINDEEDKCPTVPGVASQQGCPETSKEVTKTVKYSAENIYFKTGSTALSSRSNAALNETVKVLNDNPGLKLKVDGHTDNVGSDEYNVKLSEGRAASVKTYLVNKGIDAARVESEGFGETTPVADNKTAAGRQKNRRVEMKVYY
jgi:outer membrane protein OmpA-like peptidoglycan-associated protein